MASSTEERFRRDALPAPPARTESGSVPTGLVVVAPPAPVALTDLLAGYRSALQVADQRQAMLTVRAGDGRFTRRVRVPRLRMFLRYCDLCRHRHKSHLRRDFKAHAEGLAAEQAFGEAGLRICEQLFWAWEIFQHTGDRHDLKLAIRALRRQLKAILRTYAAKQARYRYTRGMARNLLKVWPALWTFADHDGVQPTNNHAERALRGAVIYRKLSLGSQSDGGERRIERLLSIHTTCRLQRRPLHDYLVDAISAHTRGDPAPLLA